MKTTKRIFNWILFIVVIAVFFFIGGQYYHFSQKKTVIPNTKYLLNQTEPDVAFIGNSHIHYAVFPFIVNDLIPSIQSVSLTHYPGQLLNYNSYIKTLAEKENPPSLIVLDAHTLLVNDHPIFYSVKPFFYFDLFPEFFVYTKASQQLKYLLPLLEVHTYWKRDYTVSLFLQNYFSSQVDEEILLEMNYPSADYFVDRTVIDEEKFADGLGSGVLPVWEGSEWVLREYREFCETQGIDLIIVNFPSLNQWGETHEEIAALAKDLNIPYYELNVMFKEENNFGNIIYVGFDNAVDGLNSHINSMGGLVSSLEMAEIISERLDAPLDEEKFAEYQEVVLTDINITISDDEKEFTIEVLPLISSETTLYDWIVRGRENGKIVPLERQRNSKSTTYTFSSEAWEKAQYLNLKIVHPVLDYMGGYLELRIHH